MNMFSIKQIPKTWDYKVKHMIFHFHKFNQANVYIVDGFQLL